MNAETPQTKASFNSPFYAARRSLEGFLFSLFIATFTEIILGFTFDWSDWITSTGRWASLLLTFFIIHRFAVSSLDAFKNAQPKHIATLAVSIIGSVLITWFGEVISHGIHAYGKEPGFLHGVSKDSILFATPWGTTVLILQVVLGLEFAFVSAISTAFILGVFLDNDAVLVPYVFCTGLTAGLSLIKFRSRSAYIKAGFNVALVSIPLTITSFLLSSDVLLYDGVIRVICGFSGGIILAFLAAGLTPLVEHLGGYVTDMRLIELATLDHPLLKELSVQAPGTWNHSMVMGMMVESAADAVGANPVIARVSAYFHDVGKTKKPLYFVENQQGQDNRHDKLSPSMSALIIRSHVKDGLEMAKKHSLPSSIQDAINQHHGTSVIEYFYDKALKEAKEHGDDAPEVEVSLYTYPGPKPQTKEAGLLMIADAIEAAARTLSEPTQDRIRGMVQKLINKIFASGQLNECPLTLQDLHRIAKAFTRVLTGIYHHRVAYGEPAEKSKEERPKEKEIETKVLYDENLERSGDSRKIKTSSEEERGQKSISEDLKRLGS